MSPTLPPDQLLAALRAWAKGGLRAEAAVELLAAFNDGYWIRRMASTPDRLDVRYSDDPEYVGAGPPVADIRWRNLATRPLTASSTEHAVLLIACAIGGDTRVDLGNELTRLGRHGIECVTAAVRHAGGVR